MISQSAFRSEFMQLWTKMESQLMSRLDDIITEKIRAEAVKQVFSANLADQETYFVKSTLKALES